MNQEATAKPYCEYGTFLRRRYGEPVYRVPVDLGLGCPNRSGPNGTGGCAYCGDFGSRAVHVRPAMSVREQVEAGIALARDRYGASGFMAYLQAFTSTNAPAERLRELYDEVLALAPFRALIISTRPDCLPPDTVELLAELAQRLDLWVELGVQTANDATLERINRGHDFACSRRAIETLAARGLQTAAHVILGLPGEGRSDCRSTATALAALPLSGIKIHNLHVVEDTPVAAMWRRGEVTAWNEHEYGEVLMDFLRRTPHRWPIMRMMSETPAERLLAPQWWLTKGQFVGYIQRQMTERGWRQGDLCGPAGARSTPAPRPASAPRHAGDSTKEAVLDMNEMQDKGPEPRSAPGGRADLSRTIAFDSPRMAEKSWLSDPVVKGLVAGADMPKRIAAGDVIALDIGFGLGFGALGVADIVPEGAPHRVKIVALGLEATVLSETHDLPPKCRALMERVAATRRAQGRWGKLKVYWGDPRRNLFRIRGRAHVIVIEPTPMEKQIELFTVDFLRRVAWLLAPDGVIVTPVADAPCRSALRRVGLFVGRCHPKLLPGGGTLAAWSPHLVKHPLTPKEHEVSSDFLSAVPYRDIALEWSAKKILRHRQDVMARLRRRGPRSTK